MAKRTAIEFLTAHAGAGKSFNEVVQLVDEFIPQGEGTYYTNLPLFIDKICDYCEEKYNIDPEEIEERIHVIPQDEIKLWEQQTKEPVKRGETPIGLWDYFEDIDISNSRIVIDEIHNFCGDSTPRAIKREWSKWLGEIRHRGATFRCISQSPEKVAKEIKREAQIELTLWNTAGEKDCFFKIELGDWMELYAGLLGGTYRTAVFETTIKKNGHKKNRKEKPRFFTIKPEYFELYDSFSAPIAHGGKKFDGFKHEYEKRTKPELIKWFIQKNLYQISTRIIVFLMILSFLVYVYAFNGHKTIIEGLISTMNIANPYGKKKSKKKSKRKPHKYKTARKKEPPPEVYKNNLIAKKLSNKNKELKTKIEQIEIENEKLKKQIEEQSKIILLTPKSIILNSGQEYLLNEIIKNGKYKDKKIIEIDWKKRNVKFEDNTVINMCN
jgi:hypothetical protein